MNINRHNYETFFLLYVDNELSAADRKAVDIFVRENPDLKMELVLLQHTVFTDDVILMDKKEGLYREAEITALQESLLLYADDELLPGDKKRVELMLVTDKGAMAEWAELKQTKSEPDNAIVFSDKQSLYRTAGGRVVAFRWWRAAAAAVILGFGLWAGIGLYNNNNVPGGDAGALAGNNENAVHINKVPVKSSTEAESMVKKNTGDSEPAAKIAEANNSVQPVSSKGDRIKTVQPKEAFATRNVSSKKKDNNLPKPYLENINNSGGNENVIASVLPENRNSNGVSGNKEAVVLVNPVEKLNRTVMPDRIKLDYAEPTNMTAMQVANKQPDENKNARYLDVDDGKEKRTALGGFLRKAKRVLERTTNIDTGEGVKIAGFEIALK